MLSRQVSWLAGQCCCPAFPKPFGLSDFVGQRLAAYSCGGSSGFGFFGRTGFPLSFGKTFPKNHDGFTYRQGGVRVNSTADGSAWRRLFTASAAGAKNFARAAQVPLTR